ncbi:unnamed protein product [Arabidopsis thaliana]|uniref:(thale cress) hypothetical protein n=1 Tax=Arabidopsis thaliana TaxID=3702 RepID=A0A7G2EAD5_ARATH|nr:unnamed protein product [Arabidopsis thaliana]
MPPLKKRKRRVAGGTKPIDAVTKATTEPPTKTKEPSATEQIRIIIAPIKTGDKAPQVDEFCLKAVSDLTFCRNFQWGRYSFDYMLGTISHTVNHFNGSVTNKEKYIWPVPGFCLPIEAIPQLREKFIEDIAGADPGCPRMWKLDKKMVDQLNEIITMISDLDKRVESLEAFKDEHKAEERKIQSRSDGPREGW